MWFVSWTITVVETGAEDGARSADRNNKQAILRNCAPFIDCITQINNTQVDNVKDLDVVMPMYKLIEYSDNYLKTSASLYQFCRDESNDNITDSESFKSKSKFLDFTNNGSTINAKNSCAIKLLK